MIFGAKCIVFESHIATHNIQLYLVVNEWSVTLLTKIVIQDLKVLNVSTGLDP